MEGKWRIEMLGHLALRSGSVVHTRFYSHKVAYLLAWLAYHPNRQFSRDELIEILWPDGALRSGRASLRQALAMLRRHLEPQGVPFGSVLLANYAQVGLNPDAIVTDVAEFESTLDRTAETRETESRFTLVKAAVNLYNGDLLPGFYEDWAVRERERLTQRARDAINRLAALAEQRGDRATGLDCAWRLVGMDPADEEANLTLIRLLAETGQHSLAQTRYALFWDAFADLYGEPPSDAVQARLRAWNVPPPDRNAINPSPRTAPRQFRAGANTLSPTAPCSDSPTPARPPLMLTPTFGREEEIRLLCDTLRKPEVRLLTVTGLGGIGKTRVALETATALEFSGRTLCVSLAEIAQGSDLLIHLLHALSVAPTPDLPLVEQVVSALAEEPCLLLLDNFEHLVAGGAEIVHTLLTRLPALKCLVTSRQHLNVEGENEFPLKTLPLPEIGTETERLLKCPSVQLFVERARAAKPEFQVTSRNADDIATVCRQLEGLPLAIELAAARIPVVSVTQMPKQLERRLAFLVGGRRNASTRLRSVRAMLDWSFQLLSPSEQRLLAYLSVFRGGWTLEAATAIFEDPQTLEKLESLYACSLLIAEERETGVRYRMLETVRDYAAERLAERGEANAVQRRHADYVTALAEEAAVNIKWGRDVPHHLDRLEEEAANLREALSGLRGQPTARGLRLAVALSSFWVPRGYLEEARTWFDIFLNAPDIATDPALSIRARLEKGEIALEQGDSQEAHALFSEVATETQQCGMRAEMATALLNLGRVLDGRGDYAGARHSLFEALQIAREIGDLAACARALNSIANTHYMEQEFALCAPLYEEAIALFEQMGATYRAATVIGNLGLIRMEMGDWRGAERDLLRALDAHRHGKTKRNIGLDLNNLGNIYIRIGDWERAENALNESLQIVRAHKNLRSVFFVLSSLRHLRCRQGDLFGAEQFAREALALYTSLGLSDKRIALHCVETLAIAAAADKRWEQAACLFGILDTWQPSERDTDPSRDPELYHRQRRAALSAVEPDVWEHYQRNARELSWEHVTDFALFLK